MIFLARFWPVFAVAALLGLLTWWAHVALDRADQRGYDRATGEMQISIAAANAKGRSDEQAAQARANEVDREHQKAITDLVAKYAARPVPAVRLCPPAARQVHLPSAPAAASVDTAGAGRDGLPGAVAPDIGPQLEQLVRVADEQTERLISCQAFINAR